MGDDRPSASLIYLDVDDEITSAAARIRASDAERVTLVLPYGSRLATSRINFRLLAREATARAKQVEIITADASARSLAAAAGLTVHPSVAAYEAARTGTPVASGSGAIAGGQPDDDTSATTGLWSASAAAASAAASTAAAGAEPGGAAPSKSPAATASGDTGVAPPGAAAVPVGGLDIEDDAPTRVVTVPRRKAGSVPLVGPPRPPVRTGLAVGIGLAAIVLVAVGAMVALELLPSATIVLAPRAEPIRPLSLAVEARTDITAVDAENLLIPAQRIEFDLSATYLVTATGVKVEETKATGTVTFSNFDTGGGVFIPAGTKVRTEGKDKVEFETLADVSLPAAQIDFFPPFPVRPSTSSVGVEAVKAGEDGNVGNNTITVVPGGGRNLFVTNAEPTSGGSRSEAPEISQDDVDAAIAAIDMALTADLDAQLATGINVPDGMTTFPAVEPISEPSYSVDPMTLVGSPELEVEITATAAGAVIGVDVAPIETLARTRLQEQVVEGWSIDPDSVVFSLSTPSQFGETVSYPFTIAGTQVHAVDEAALIDSIRGLVLPEARTKLAAYGDAQVTLWPDWVTTIPDNADRITLTLTEPAPAPSPTP